MDDNKPKVRNFGKTIGSWGGYNTGGFITAEEYNAALVGTNGLRKYDIMRRSDPTVRSTLRVVKLPILQADWYIEPASEDEQDVFNARHIENELLHKLNWQKVFGEALTCLDFGHSVIEITLELTEFEGKTLVGIKELGYRKQTTILNWELSNGEQGITQQTNGGGTVEIPRAKLMYFVHDQEGQNYQGVSLLRYTYKPWDIKDRLELINAIALEKMAIGVPVVEVPTDASPEEIAKADDAMSNFRGNESAYQRVPKGFTVSMLDLKANSTKDVMPTIKYYDREIQLSVLAQFLSLGGTDASGSRAVSDDQSKLFLMSEEALAKQMQTVWQKELIEPLCDLNFSDLKNGYPQLKFGKIGDDNVVEIAGAVRDLFSSGAMTYDPEVENNLRRMIKLPEIPEERMELLKEKLDNEEDETTVAKDAKPTSQVDEETKKDVEASVALQEAKAVRKRLIGALAGA